MLINTVILFLSHSLAIFMVVALLLSLQNKYQLVSRWPVYGTVVGVVIMVILLSCIDVVAQSFDDFGLEWLYITMQILIYVFAVLLIKNLLSMTVDDAVISKDHQTKALVNNNPRFTVFATSILALIVILEGINFLIYFTGFWSQVNTANALFIGVVLGGGICLSIGILLYFFCGFLNKSFSAKSTEWLLILFACGLLNKTTSLLSQIDILPSGKALLDVDFLVKETSELGHLLSAFFGYDASLSLLQLSIYLSALIFAIFGCFFTDKPRRTRFSKEVS